MVKGKSIQILIGLEYTLFIKMRQSEQILYNFTSYLT